GLPEVRLGRMPSAGGTQRLPRLVGPGIALRMLLLGELLIATAAVDIGLVHRIAPRRDLESSLETLVSTLRGAAPVALAYKKEAVRWAADVPPSTGLTLEADLAALLQTTTDRSSGIRAFQERSTPEFEGR